jgi:hypothetical protein
MSGYQVAREGLRKMRQQLYQLEQAMNQAEKAEKGRPDAVAQERALDLAERTARDVEALGRGLAEGIAQRRRQGKTDGPPGGGLLLSGARTGRRGAGSDHTPPRARKRKSWPTGGSQICSSS